MLKIILAVCALAAVIENNALAHTPVYPGTDAATQDKVRIYNFNKLYKTLGYSDALFGAAPVEIDALRKYTDQTIAIPNYKDINNYLRSYPMEYPWTTIPPELAAQITLGIDGIFAKVPPLPDDMVLFRGVTMAFRGNKNYESGEEYVDKAYVSTSLSAEVAKHFVFGLNDDKTAKSAILVIYFDKPGHKGILINSSESEILLMHGNTFKVMDIRPLLSNPGLDLCLVQLCTGSCAQDIPERIMKFWRHYKLSLI